MPLNKVQLIARLKAAGDKASLNDNKTPQERRDTWAQEVADAIDEFVKTGTVTVTTTGNATTQTGTGTIS